MHYRPRRRLGTVISVLAALGAIGAAIAILGPFSAGAEHVRQVTRVHRSHGAHRTASARAAATERTAETIRSRFGLLRETQPGPPPAALLANIARAPASYGLVGSMARQTSDGTWLIPGSDGTCLAINDDEGIGMSCAPNAATEDGELRFSIRNQTNGDERIIGAVPDGRTSVRALAGDGTTLATARVTENTYQLSVRDAARFIAE